MNKEQVIEVLRKRYAHCLHVMQMPNLPKELFNEAEAMAEIIETISFDLGIINEVQKDH